MDNTTIYEFLQEKNITPLGPSNYSNSAELGNSSKTKTNKKANVNALKELYVAMGGDANDVVNMTTVVDVLNSICTLLGGTSDANLICDAITNIIPVVPSSTEIVKGVVDRNITNIVIPNGTIKIGNYAFRECSNLESVTIPNTVTNIGYNAFQNCTSLENVTIPDSIMIIGSDVFNGCTVLESITIGNGVTNIGAHAFDGCTALETITINKAQNSVTGAPWGAPNATVEWTG